MFKLACAVVPCLIGCLAAALPARAQDIAPDASAFQRGPWAELGTLEDGATLSLSQAQTATAPC